MSDLEKSCTQTYLVISWICIAFLKLVAGIDATKNQLFTEFQRDEQILFNTKLPFFSV